MFDELKKRKYISKPNIFNIRDKMLNKKFLNNSH